MTIEEAAKKLKKGERLTIHAYDDEIKCVIFDVEKYDGDLSIFFQRTGKVPFELLMDDGAIEVDVDRALNEMRRTIKKHRQMHGQLPDEDI